MPSIARLLAIGSHIAVILLLLLNSASVMATSLSRDEDIKAAFVFHLLRFTEWPTIPGTINFCVLGKAPVTAVLEEVRKKKGSTVSFEIQEVSKDSALSKCHALFLPNDYPLPSNILLNRVADKPILTISDRENFAQEGGIVEMIKEDDTINLMINIKAMKQARTTINANILRVVKILQ